MKVTAFGTTADLGSSTTWGPQGWYSTGQEDAEYHSCLLSPLRQSRTAAAEEQQ